MNDFEFRGVSGHYYDNSFVSESNHLVQMNTKKLLCKKSDFVITLIKKNNWLYT